MAVSMLRDILIEKKREREDSQNFHFVKIMNQARHPIIARLGFSVSVEVGHQIGTGFFSQSCTL